MSSSSIDRAVSGTATSQIALPDVAQLRQSAYRFFAALFLFPDDKRLSDLAEAALEALSDEDFVFLFPFSGAWLQLLDTIAGSADLDRRAIKKEYRNLFLAFADAPACPPYESSYLDRHGQDAGLVSAQLIQRCREAGLTLAPAMEQTPDHVAVELEFMAFLCGHEELAWQGEVSDSGNRALKRQRAFLRRHLGWWFPALTRKITVTDHDGFYAQVARVAGAFIHHEADLIELLLTHSSEAPATTGGDDRAI